MSYLDENGRLILARWADQLEARLPEATAPMYGTSARALPLVTNGRLGLDLVQVPAGGGFEPHTHPGDHLLVVVSGRGTITYDGVIYETVPGQVYLVEGAVPHAVGAITDHAILAVGAPHRRADDADRMALTEYAAVAAELGQLTCLPCGGRATFVGDPGCPHNPKPRPRSKPILVTTLFDRNRRRELADAMNLRKQDFDRLVVVAETVAWEHPPAAVAGLRARLGRDDQVAVVYGPEELIRDMGHADAYGPPVWATVGRERSYLLVYVDEGVETPLLAGIVGLACTMAAAGPLDVVWTRKDAARFIDAVIRMPAAAAIVGAMRVALERRGDAAGDPPS